MLSLRLGTSSHHRFLYFSSAAITKSLALLTTLVLTAASPSSVGQVLELKNIQKTGLGFQVVGATGELGLRVAAGGDINNDGVDDVILGAPFTDSRRGTAYVIFGKRDGYTGEFQLSSLNGSNGFSLSGEAIRNRAGDELAGIGDFNGDGFDDIALSAWRFAGDDGSMTDAGAVYVIYGRSGFAAQIPLASLDGNNGFRVEPKAAWERLRHVSSLGDINGDNFADLGAGNNVILGSNAGMPARFDQLTLNGSNGYTTVRRDTGAGIIPIYPMGWHDENSDGLSDTYFQFYDVDLGGNYTQVVLSTPTPYITPFFTPAVTPTLSTFGHLTPVGDFNGDGNIDYYVERCCTNGITEYHVAFGGTDLSTLAERASVDGRNGFIIGSRAERTDQPLSITSGDVNGDGLSDIIYSVLASSGRPPGSYFGSFVAVIYGTRQVMPATLPLFTLDGTDGLVIRGFYGTSNAGIDLAALDFNDDGFDDIVIGDNAYPGGFFGGTVALVYGRSDLGTVDRSNDALPRIAITEGDLAPGSHGWFQFTDGSKQYVDADCRLRLEATSKFNTVILWWGLINDMPDAVPQNCDALLALGEPVRAGLSVTTATSDRYRGAGELINLSVTIRNTATQPQTNIQVSNDRLGEPFCTLVTLAPDASGVCTGTDTTTVADVTRGSIQYVVQARSDQTTTEITDSLVILRDDTTNTPYLITTPDRADAGNYAWVVFGDGSKQWVSGDCRDTLQSNGWRLDVQPWPVIAEFIEASPQRCEQLTGNLPDPVLEPRLVTTPDKQDAGNYAWVHFPDNTKQWVDATCRATLRSEGVELAVLDWAQIAEYTDRFAVSCEHLIPRARTSLITTPDREARGNYAWFDFGNGTKQWIDGNCRNRLQDKGLLITLLPWPEIAQLADVTNTVACDALE